ncbi:hypothetical protein DPMN_188685 [Dreissena polymorpha]|uniref:Uncharacterized protein n=1 Tax=Dreissena polymorpha TaxID=45954 RepID=A0A9D4DTW0_DREPO|nr:hypothetical protein DPMN_188685 [Dreissena polymorpha]
MGETLGMFQTKVVGYIELLHVGNGDTVPQLAAKQRFGNDCGLVQLIAVFGFAPDLPDTFCERERNVPLIVCFTASMSLGYFPLIDCIIPNCL